MTFRFPDSLETILSARLPGGDMAMLPRYASSMPARNIRAFLIAFTVLTAHVVAQQAATAPVASGKGDVLFLRGPSHDAVSLSASVLKALPHITVTVHNPHANAEETYSGVRLADLLAKVGAPIGSELRGKALANYVVATGSDGYQAVLALGEVDPGFHPGEVIVADSMDGKALDAHSGPFKLVVTEDKRPARSVRNLTNIEVKSVQ
jgi:hypothetical protein